MMTPETHADLLRTMTLEDLLTLMTLEANTRHGGVYTIHAFNSGFKVAFGAPDLLSGAGYAQVAAMTHSPTLKEAVIAALVVDKEFEDYFHGDVQAWWMRDVGGVDCGAGVCTGEGHYTNAGVLLCGGRVCPCSPHS
jgi:hypothetical protein